MAKWINRLDAAPGRHALASCRLWRYNALQIGGVLPLFAVFRSFWKRYNSPAG